MGVWCGVCVVCGYVCVVWWCVGVCVGVWCGVCVVCGYVCVVWWCVGVCVGVWWCGWLEGILGLKLSPSFFDDHQI